MSIHMDLHCHSEFSDGSCSPTEVVRMARAAGVELLALTDHDTMDGVPEALQAGRAEGVHVLPAVEFDTEMPYELHMLGLDVDPDAPELRATLQMLLEGREKRNAVILEKLKRSGYDVYGFMPPARGSLTRLHIAKALCAAGFAKDIMDAFVKFLNPGCPGYHEARRLTPCETVALILRVGGIPALAHPCHIRANIHKLVGELAACGLKGIEAYYPSCSMRQTQLYLSLAAQHKLYATPGSDFHGLNRAGHALGCAWRDTADLNKTAQMFMEKIKNRIDP